MVENSHKYYIYLHRRLIDNSIFYVGKGSRRRAWRKCDRSNEWNYEANLGYITEILIKNIDEEFAYLLEIECIDKYKKMGCNLVNKNDGGAGCKSENVSIATKEKLKLKTLKNHQENPQRKIDNSKNMKIFWKDLDYIQRQHESRCAVWSNPEYKEMQSKERANRYSIQENREKMSIACTGIKNASTCEKLYQILELVCDFGIMEKRKFLLKNH